MARKRWEAKTEITPELLEFREKRKWQINLRRYVIEKSPCPNYAPYFGLDIENMRKWFEYQFVEGLSWENFAKNWQFDHIVPITYFNHSLEEDLRLCWNFSNLRVGPLVSVKTQENTIDILGARAYFDNLFLKTGYPIASTLSYKISQIESSQLTASAPQQRFLTEHRDYLKQIGTFSNLEFELLNHGRSIEEVKKEVALLEKNSKP